MKAEIGTAEQESFISAYLLRFDNGLILRTKDCLWLSGSEKTKIKEQFAEVVRKLQQAGVEIIGQEKLK